MENNETTPTEQLEPVLESILQKSNDTVQALETIIHQNEKNNHETALDAIAIASNKSSKALEEINETGKSAKVSIKGDVEKITLRGKDGKDGKDGERGPKGDKGDSGKDGKDGRDGRDGTNGKDGKQGLPGKDGTDGRDGIDGVHGQHGKNGKNGSPDTAEEIIAKLKSLKKGNRLSYDDLDDTPDYLSSKGKTWGNGFLTELSDVTISSLSVNQVIGWNGTRWVNMTQSGSGGIPDGDKGDITVSGSGTIWTIDSGLDAAKIGGGAVSNTEFGYLDGVTSAIQTQINTKISASSVDVLTNKDLTSGTNTFPTFNQNTTGSAAKWTTARNLAGNSVDGSANVAFSNKFIVQGTTDAGLSGAQFLGALATGMVKNATTTGVLSIGVAGTDYSAGTSALGTGIIKSTTGTGAFTIAVAGDFPTLNQNTTGSAATLTTSRNINGVAFNGSADITVTAAAGTLTGTTLNSSVVTSSLTSVGTIGTGVWNGTAINGAFINYNTTNLKVTTNQLNTIQDIATTSTPQFGKLGLGTASLSTSYLALATSTTGISSANIPSGTKPTSPVEGDIWNDSTGKYIGAFVDGIVMPFGGCIFASTAGVTVTATTTKTSIVGTGQGTTTLPANFWTVGKTMMVKVTFNDIDTDATPGSWNVNLEYGATNLLTVSGTPTASQTNGLGDIEFYITCTAIGASGSLRIYGVRRFAYSGVSQFFSSATTTINTTTSNAMDVTIQFGNANAGNSVTSQQSLFYVNR